MGNIMKGSDVSITLKNIPDGMVIKRLDFSQNDNIVITKTTEDFVYDGETYVSELTQEDTLKLDEKYMVEIQLSYKIGDKADRTPIVKCPASKILYQGVV